MVDNLNATVASAQQQVHDIEVQRQIVQEWSSNIDVPIVARSKHRLPPPMPRA